MLRSMEQTRHSWHLGREIKHTQGIGSQQSRSSQMPDGQSVHSSPGHESEQAACQSNEELKLSSQSPGIRPGQVTEV